MKRSSGEHHVERFTGQGPLLERRRNDLHRVESGKISPSHSRHVRAQLDSHDAVTPLGQRHSRLPSATADLQHSCPRRYPGRSEIIKHLDWYRGRARSYRAASSLKVSRNLT